MIGFIAGGAHRLLHHVNKTGILKHPSMKTKTDSKIEPAPHNDDAHANESADDQIQSDRKKRFIDMLSVPSEDRLELNREISGRIERNADAHFGHSCELCKGTKMPEKTTDLIIDDIPSTESDLHEVYTKRRERDIVLPCGAMVIEMSPCSAPKGIQESIGEFKVNRPIALSLALSDDELDPDEEFTRRRKRDTDAKRSKRHFGQPCEVCKGVKPIQESIGELSLDNPVAPALPVERLELAEMSMRRRKRDVDAQRSRRHDGHHCKMCKDTEAIQVAADGVLVDTPSAAVGAPELDEMDAGRQKREAVNSKPCDAAPDENLPCNAQRAIQKTIGEIFVDSPVTLSLLLPAEKLELGEVNAVRSKRSSNSETPTVILNYELIVEHPYAAFHNDDTSSNGANNSVQTQPSVDDKTDEETPKVGQTLAHSQAKTKTTTPCS